MMNYEFQLKDKKTYFRNVLKTVGMAVPTILFLLVQFAVRGKVIGTIALITGGILIFTVIFLILFQYSKDKNKRYALSTDSLQVIVLYEIKHYLFSELIKINRSARGNQGKSKMESLQLVFRDGRKVKLYSYLPFYHDFKDVLAGLLKTGGYTAQIQIKHPLV